MRVADVDPNLVRLLGALTGAAFGAAGVKLADLLPARYGIEHLATPSRRRRRNIAVVLVTIAVGLGVAHVIATMMPAASFASGAFLIGVNSLLAASVISAAAIDFEHMILPNELTIGGALVSLATSPWRSIGVRGAFAGVAVGLVLAYLPLFLYKIIRRRSGMGGGDAKLLILAGAWQGIEGVLFILLAAAVQSVLCAVIMRVIGVKYTMPESVRAELDALRAQAEAGDESARDELADDPMAEAPREGTLAMRMPLGPFLALACIELLLAKRWIFTHLFDWLG